MCLERNEKNKDDPCLTLVRNNGLKFIRTILKDSVLMFCSVDDTPLFNFINRMYLTRTGSTFDTYGVILDIVVQLYPVGFDCSLTMTTWMPLQKA